MVDVLASRSEEGRSRLRKATVSCQRAHNRGCPNGATFYVEDVGLVCEKIAYEGERGELKHLSNLRKGKKTRLPK